MEDQGEDLPDLMAGVGSLSRRWLISLPEKRDEMHHLQDRPYSPRALGPVFGLAFCFFEGRHSAPGIGIGDR